MFIELIHNCNKPRSKNFKTKFVSLVCCLGCSLSEILIECFIHDWRPANPYLFQFVLILNQAFFNEGLVPPLLALVAETWVKLEVAYVFLLTEFLKSLAHIEGDSFFLFGKRHIQYEGEHFTELFFFSSFQLTQIFPH